MIISLIKIEFILKQFQKEQVWGGCFLILLLCNSKPPYIQIVYKSFISGIPLIYELVHSSRDNK